MSEFLLAVEALPDEWKVDVVVVSITRDNRGNIVRGDPVTVQGCLPAWQNSTDPADIADFTEDKGYLFPPGQADVFVNGAEVTIPNNISGPKGKWYVDGQPRQWPLGVEVRLSRG